jgi:hypothetical protein
MKNYKTFYERGIENIWNDEYEQMPKGKRHKKNRKDRHRRIKFSIDRHSPESFFKGEDL